MPSPLAETYPTTFIPTLLIVTTFAAAALTLKRILPFGTILILLLPLITSPWKWLAITKLPRFAFPASILPLKLAVFPPKLLLTVKLLIVTALVKFAVLPDTSSITFKLPDTPRSPVTFAPVLVTTNERFPFDVKLMLPSTVGIVTLLLPLDTPLVLIVANERLPAPSVWTTCPLLPPVKITFAMLPKLALFATTKSKILPLVLATMLAM